MKILSSSFNKQTHWTIDLEKKVKLLAMTFKGQPKFYFPDYKYNGISKEKKQGLFQPFIQAENNSTRSYDGSGLGLSICYELVTLMSGKISVQSELGLGSTFVLTLSLPITKPTSAVFSEPLKSTELKENKLRHD
ncbi:MULTISPECIES: ATP-binding protein [Colwellia]|uniref:histidine kinase n=1 Tax=Colwellia marinimaniae TaxID=1513592 RepID=A0ABQ0MZB7_9GAMM|nr:MULTISPECIES: ATP-binding protein [Colwellia]GAW97705.1 hybrid sensor histidine kinase/response regulator [Colwellia marinimaniae]